MGRRDWGGGERERDMCRGWYIVLVCFMYVALTRDPIAVPLHCICMILSPLHKFSARFRLFIDQ